jgi:hypothetical protein
MIRASGSDLSTHSGAIRIGRLAPGESVEVTLPALAVATGGVYTLWVSVGVGSLPKGPVVSPLSGVGQIERVRIKVAPG